MGRLNLGRRFLGLRPFSYTKVGLAELVNKPEAEFEVVNCWCAAVAVFNAVAYQGSLFGPEQASIRLRNCKGGH